MRDFRLINSIAPSSSKPVDPDQGLIGVMFDGDRRKCIV